MKKKILMISFLIPIIRFSKTNDIVIKTINEIKGDQKGIEFFIIKPIIYSNSILKFLKKKWRDYYYTLKKKKEVVKGNDIHFIPWLSLNSNLNVISFLAPINYILYKKKIRKLITNNNFDLIHAQYFFPDGYIAMRLSKELKIPYILTVRGYKEKMYYNDLIVKILSNAEKVLTPSPFAFRSLKSKYNIELLPHGIDNEYFIEEEKDLKKIRLLTVAMLIKLKNIDKIILSLAEIKKASNVDFEYRIVGEGPEFKYLKDLVDNLELNKQIMFYDQLNKTDVIEQYKWSNVFVMPSYPETIGRVFLEAAASYNAIIGVKNTGADGIFINGQSGIFIDKESIISQLSKTISGLSENQMVKLTTNARTIAEKFKNKKVINRYVKIYETMKYNN